MRIALSSVINKPVLLLREGSLLNFMFLKSFIYGIVFL